MDLLNGRRTVMGSYFMQFSDRIDHPSSENESGQRNTGNQTLSGNESSMMSSTFLPNRLHGFLNPDEKS
jgi:hypothetical protein